MISKTIHYCWFGGGAKPKLAEKCIASWHRYCPDYTIVEWNEDNFDFSQSPYLQWCREQKKWAFLSDLARLLIINEQGGIYFDTDVELLKKPDELLQYAAFYGFENDENIATGLGFGAEAGHVSLQAMIAQYSGLAPDAAGNYPTINCPKLNTAALLPYGLKLNGQRQTVVGAEIFPVEYFNPYEDTTGRLNKTEHTISVHWYAKSWLSNRLVLRSKLTKPLHRLFGKDIFSKLNK